MDKKRSLLNVSVSITCKILVLGLSLINRRVIIREIGNDVNGLNSLYSSIIGVLAVAELGVGAAISFSMYKPIVEKDERKIAALYQLFKKSYLVIGAIIYIAGLFVLPFLPRMMADYSSITISIYLPYVLLLTSTVMSYAYNAKASLINAYKDNYVTALVNSASVIVRNICQIFVALKTHSFAMFVGCTLISTAFEWILIEKLTSKRYGNILHTKPAELTKTDKQELVKNIYAMFMHKIGTLLVNTADSIIISTFIGVQILGKYSNYVLIMSSISSIISLFLSPLTSIIGHSYVEEDIATSKRHLQIMHEMNLIICAFFILGYYAVIPYLISTIFGEGLLLSKNVALVICINTFVYSSRNCVLIFRDATGTFYWDRWKPLFEGISNIILSILLVKILPDDMKIVGVIIATIITSLLICHTVEPYVLYKFAFVCSPVPYYIRNYSLIASFLGFLFILDKLLIFEKTTFIEFLVNGMLSVFISMLFSLMVINTNKDFKSFLLSYKKKIAERLKDQKK